jgi:hypothetical protein
MQACGRNQEENQVRGMQSYGVLCPVAHVKTDLSEEVSPPSSGWQELAS